MRCAMKILRWITRYVRIRRQIYFFTTAKECQNLDSIKHDAKASTQTTKWKFMQLLHTKTNTKRHDYYYCPSHFGAMPIYFEMSNFPQMEIYSSWTDFSFDWWNWWNWWKLKLCRPNGKSPTRPPKNVDNHHFNRLKAMKHIFLLLPSVSSCNLNK